MTYIYGIGRSSSAKILDKAGIDRDLKVKDWTDEQAGKIREIIGAEYKVEITYTPRTEGSRFQLCFNNAQTVICNLGGEKDRPTTAAGRFVADTANGYNGTISAWLLVSFGGGKSSDIIEIDSITVTRLKAAPVVTDGKFTGEEKDGFLSAGELTLSYNVSAPAEGGETIRWVASTAADLSENVIELKTAYTSEAGAKSVTVDDALKGLYIGAYVTPNVDPDKYQIADAPVFVTDKKAIGEVTYKDVDLTKEGASFTEDFTSFGEQNITFRNMGGNAYIKQAPSGMSGNALYVECDGSSQYQGLRFGGVTVKKEGVYRVSFKVMFLGSVPDSWTVKFRPGESYWDDVQTETSLAGKETGVVYTIELAPMRLGSNDEPYGLLMHNYMRETTVVIDDLTIEKVEPVTLAKPGDKAALDFDENYDIFYADSNADLKSASAVVAGDKLTGNYLSVTPSAADVVGTTFSGFNMTAGKYYRLRMDLILESDAALGGQFLVKFMADDGTYVQDMQYSSSILNSQKVSYVTNIVKLEEGKNYTSIDVLNYYSSYPMYIDNIVVEVVEAPDALKEAAVLAAVGDFVSDDFEGDTRAFAVSSVNPFVEKTDDLSEIGASFGKALKVEFKGSQGAYNIASFTNYTLKAGMTYRVTFDYKVLEADTENKYATALIRLDSEADGYPEVHTGLWVGEVSKQVQQFSYDFTITGASDGWKFGLSNWSEDVHAVILLDNLKIEMVQTPEPEPEPDTLKAEAVLNEVGDVVFDDFEGSERAYSWTQEKVAAEKVSDTSGIGEPFGTALRVEFGGGQGEYNLLTFANYMLKGGGTYKVTFNYKVIQADTTNNYASAVMRLNDAAENYPNVQKGLWVGAVSEDVQQFSEEFTLTGTNDNWKLCLSNWGSDVHAVILIDDLKIEKVA